MRYNYFFKNCLTTFLLLVTLGNVGCKVNNAQSFDMQKLEAKGDGIADDTEALQRALNQGGTVYLPAGIYRTQPLRYSSNTIIRGEGDKTIVKLFFKTPPNTLTSQSVLYPRNMDIGQTKNVRFENLTIDGQWEKNNWQKVKGDGNANGISLKGVKNARIENVKIVNCWTDGIYIGGTRKAPVFSNSEDVVIRNVDIEHCGRQGISVISLKGGTFENLSIKDINRTAPRAGIDLEPNNYAPENIENLTFNKVKIENAGQGFIISAVARPKNITVKNLSVKDLNTAYGVAIRGADEVVLDSISVITGKGKSKYSLLYVANSTDVEIRDVTLDGGIGPASVEFQCGNNTVKTNVSLSDFSIYNAEKSGLLVKDQSVEAVIKNGKFIENSRNSPYPVLNLYSSKLKFEDVEVKGNRHKYAVKLNANDVSFDNCVLEEGTTKKVINANGFKGKIQNSVVGGKKVNSIKN